MEIIDRKKFAKATLDKNNEIFIMHMTFLLIIVIHPTRKAQIVLLIAKQV